MAVIEFNALSTNLSGSFSATVFVPENRFLGDEKNDHPAIYLLHDVGGDDTDFRTAKNLESLASELNLFIVAPSLMHSFGMDLRWGGKYGAFVCSELPGICQHMFPLDPKRSYIGGVGWGAYGAVMQALNHPDSFGKCVTINGKFDIASLCEAVADGGETEHLRAPMLSALFGPLDQVHGGSFDLFGGGCNIGVPLYVGCEESSPTLSENMRFSKIAGSALHTGVSEEDLFSAALTWLLA